MIKRSFDLFISFLGLIILSPILLAIAVAIKLDSSGPVFYAQERMGRAFKHFKLLKFRTMHKDAEKSGPAVTGKNDQRITPLGGFLRRYKLDELPQLFNVLKGDMSFVGPRPEVKEAVERYSQQYGKLLSVRPGITSISSIKNIDEEKLMATPSSDVMENYLSNILPVKIKEDLEYVDRNNILSDIMIICSTLIRLTGRRKTGG